MLATLVLTLSQRNRRRTLQTKLLIPHKLLPLVRVSAQLRRGNEGGVALRLVARVLHSVRLPHSIYPFEVVDLLVVLGGRCLAVSGD